MTNKHNHSRFVGVGVGPGDPELITVKAVKAIEKADIILVPKAANEIDSLALSIAKPYVSEHARIEARTFPMVKDLEIKQQAWDQIAGEIQTWVDGGHNVVFLTLGDTMTYATFVYLLERLQGEIPVEIIPGITSYQGMAAETAVPLVMDDMTMTVVPCSLPLETIRTYVQREDALVLMKLSLNFRPLIQMLIEEGMVPYARLVSHATQAKQVIYTDISKIDDDSISYFSTLTINKRWRTQ